MKYNLQFFGEEAEGAQMTEPAEQSETVNEGGDVTENTDDSLGTQTPSVEEQDAETNAMFANVRRKAEEKAQAKFQRQMDDLDMLFAAQFGDYVNPQTNQPIRSAKDYIEAWKAKQQMEREAKLREQGVDQNLLNELIDNSPQMQELKQIRDEFNRQRTIQAIDADVAELSKLDPNIKDINSVPNEVIAHAKEKGYTLTLAYKDLYFGKISAQQTASIQQRTINQIAGKAHMAPVNGVAQNDGTVDIPADKMDFWRSVYPNLSDAEIRKKYNRAINS